MQEWQKNSKKILTIVEIPLLMEKKLAYLFDRAIILYLMVDQSVKCLQIA
jgi:dephospho-CoA kinase